LAHRDLELTVGSRSIASGNRPHKV
jgi:hypothetical protein